MQNILNKEEIELLKISGKILKESLFETIRHAKAGVSTLDLDQIAEKAIRSRGATPSFKNYRVSGVPPFPASLCVSINDEVVHGIPSGEKVLHDGDIVSFDLGAEYKGIYSDMAATIPIGNISAEAKKLIEVTKNSLEKGIGAVKIGNHIGEIGNAVQTFVEKNNFGVVRDLVGHGIGTKAHMDPQIPNYGEKYEGPIIEEGMALAIEPMVTAGNYNVKVDRDGWTIRTKDGSLSAHFEHTVVICDGKILVVTA